MPRLLFSQINHWVFSDNISNKFAIFVLCFCAKSLFRGVGKTIQFYLFYIFILYMLTNYWLWCYSVIWQVLELLKLTIQSSPLELVSFLGHRLVCLHDCILLRPCFAEDGHNDHAGWEDNQGWHYWNPQLSQCEWNRTYLHCRDLHLQYSTMTSSVTCFICYFEPRYTQRGKHGAYDHF